MGEAYFLLEEKVMFIKRQETEKKIFVGSFREKRNLLFLEEGRV